MSCERALNFDQWKTISENYEPMRVWSWLVYKFAYNYCHLRLFSKFIQTQEVSYLSWPNMYPNMKTTCHIKLKFFMWTKLLENLLLAKYLISVTAPLREKKVKYFTMKIIAAFLILHEDIGKRLLQSNLRKRVGFGLKILLCFIFFFFFSVAFIFLFMCVCTFIALSSEFLKYIFVILAVFLFHSNLCKVIFCVIYTVFCF